MNITPQSMKICMKAFRNTRKYLVTYDVLTLKNLKDLKVSLLLIDIHQLLINKFKNPPQEWYKWRFINNEIFYPFNILSCLF